MSTLKDIVTGIIRPVANMVDELHTSEEEKKKLRNQLAIADMRLTSLFLDTEVKLARLQVEQVKVEATSDSLLQKSWRPILMFTCIGVIVLYIVVKPIMEAMGLRVFPEEIPPQIWSIILGNTLLLSGARTGEKIVRNIMQKKNGQVIK